MKISKKKDVLHVEISRNRKDIVTFVRDVTDLFEFMHVADDYRLTKKEKQFFIATVVSYLTGVVDAAPIYRQICDLDGSDKKIKQEMSRYTGVLAKKKWVRKVGTRKYELPPFFINIKNNVEFSLKFRYDVDSENKKGSGIASKKPENSFANSKFVS